MTSKSLKQNYAAFIAAYEKKQLPTLIYSAGEENMPQTQSLVSESHAGILPLRAYHKSFNTFKNVFNTDGSLNGHSEIAETYAVSLALDEKFTQSVEMFDSITSKKNMKDIAILVRGDDRLSPVANLFGALGFEGIFQYADSCLEIGNNDRAKELFSFIGNLHKSYTGEQRFMEIKAESLNTLVSFFRLNEYKTLLNVTNNDLNRYKKINYTKFS